MKQLRELGAVLVLAMAIFSPVAPAPPAGGLPDLVGALRATPGVLGVDAGQMLSGKQVIFAWSEKAGPLRRHSRGLQLVRKTPGRSRRHQMTQEERTVKTVAAVG